MANADLAALEQLLADDVVLIQSSGRELAGKEAVLEDLGDSLQQFRIDQAASHEETMVAGDWAFAALPTKTAQPKAAHAASVAMYGFIGLTLRRCHCG